MYKYFILLSSFFFCFFASAFSQKNEKEEAEPEMPWYQGVKVEYDVASLIMSAVSGWETYSAELGVQLNIKQKYLPVIEFGFAGANTVSHNGYGFKTNAFYGKIGIDYNLLKPQTGEVRFHRMFFIGARFGMSPFSYDVTNITVIDDYWGGEAVRNFDNEKSTAFWFEILAGLRVEIFKNVYMGWSVRNKILFNNYNKEGDIPPWYIPGMGKRVGGNWGFNYSIGYSF